MDKKQNIVGHRLKCDCGKLLAVERNGKIYVYCRYCKREVEVKKSPES